MTTDLRSFKCPRLRVPDPSPASYQKDRPRGLTFARWYLRTVSAVRGSVLQGLDPRYVPYVINIAGTGWYTFLEGKLPIGLCRFVTGRAMSGYTKWDWISLYGCHPRRFCKSVPSTYLRYGGEYPSADAYLGKNVKSAEQIRHVNFFTHAYWLAKEISSRSPAFKVGGYDPSKGFNIVPRGRQRRGRKSHTAEQCVIC